MKINMSKVNEMYLKRKKAETGVSSTWYVNNLVSKSFSFVDEISNQESCVRGFLDVIELTERNIGIWSNIRTLYDDFVKSSYNECHFISEDAFNAILLDYVKSYGLSARFNKSLTSIMINPVKPKENRQFEPNEQILDFMDKSIAPNEVIMNSQFLSRLHDSVMSSIGSGYKVLKKHQEYWAQSRGYKIVKGKVNSGRWTKFVKIEKPNKNKRSDTWDFVEN